MGSHEDNGNISSQMGHRSFTQGSQAGRVRAHIPQEAMQDRIVPPSHSYRESAPRNLQHKIPEQLHEDGWKSVDK